MNKNSPRTFTQPVEFYEPVTFRGNIERGNKPTNVKADLVFEGSISGQSECWEKYRRKGGYHTMADNGSVPNVIAQAANRITAIPVFIAVPTTITKIGIEVSTAVASSFLRVGIYTNKVGNCYPDQLVASSAELDCATTGLKETTLSPAAVLTPGLYWFVTHANSTQTLRGIPTTGVIAVLGYLGTGTAHYTCYIKTETYAALPATFPAAGVLTSASVPAVVFFISA